MKLSRSPRCDVSPQGGIHRKRRREQKHQQGTSPPIFLLIKFCTFVFIISVKMLAKTLCVLHILYKNTFCYAHFVLPSSLFAIQKSHMTQYAYNFCLSSSHPVCTHTHRLHVVISLERERILSHYTTLVLVVYFCRYAGLRQFLFSLHVASRMVRVDQNILVKPGQRRARVLSISADVHKLTSQVLCHFTFVKVLDSYTLRISGLNQLSCVNLSVSHKLTSQVLCHYITVSRWGLATTLY
jgi:hypothetical protein